MSTLERSVVVEGLDSQWITDQILACSRPSTRLINEYDVVGQFQRLGITCILNLQTPGEHSTVVDPVSDASGFAYNPLQFTENKIAFYSCPISDFSTPDSFDGIMDSLKVIESATLSGKIAIHCFAGRGRTGLVAACYLVMKQKMDPDEAIKYVRSRRSGAIETRQQVDFIYGFAKHLAEGDTRA